MKTDLFSLKKLFDSMFVNCQREGEFKKKISI